MDHFFTCPAKLPLRVMYIYIYIFQVQCMRNIPD